MAIRALRALDPGAIGLFLLALLFETPVLMLRGLLLYLAGAGLLATEGAHLGDWASQLLLATPFIWPAAALIVPFPSGWWWRHVEGGREPSERERHAFSDALELLQAHSPVALVLPRAWFVLDTPQANAAVCAQTLMLTRGLLESDHLAAVIAHELGHLAGGDGHLAAAIGRLPIRRRPRTACAALEQQGWDPIPALDHGWLARLALGVLLLTVLVLRLALRFARGGYGLRVAQPLLGSYWREREYRADAFAASLGQAEELAEFLEMNALIHDQPIPFIWLSERSHPPTELRIDRLRSLAYA